MKFSPADFRREIDDCNWIFDLFACGFDHISIHLKKPATEAQVNALLDAENQARNLLERVIQRADGQIADSVWDYLDLPGQDGLLTSKSFLLRLAALLRVIDRACDGLNYYSGYRDVRFWRNTHNELERNGLKLNRGRRGIVLKPHGRFPTLQGSWWRRALSEGTFLEDAERGDHWGSMFVNLCRVPDIPNCSVVHRVLADRVDLEDVDWSTLRVGMVPLIQQLHVGADEVRLQPGPLRIVTDDENHLIIDAGIDDCADLCARAETALRFLAARKVQIVLFPEAVVPDAVVNRIKSVLRDLSRSGSEYPVLVLAGTFDRKPDEHTGPGFNQAIVLNGRGQELWRQSKIHPYAMHPYEQQRYGVDRIFNNTKPAHEHISTTPREVVFCDSRSTGLRVTVAICEDSAQDDPCLQAIRSMCPNLVLVPVMAGALLADRGFVKTVNDLSRTPGCMSVVVNSGALARAEWENASREGRPPIGIIGLPGLLHVASGHKPHILLDLVEVIDTDNTEVLVFECPTT